MGLDRKITWTPAFPKYWTSQQRRNVERARDYSDLSLAFFSGNEAYWNFERGDQRIKN